MPSDGTNNTCLGSFGDWADILEKLQGSFMDESTFDGHLWHMLLCPD